MLKIKLILPILTKCGYYLRTATIRTLPLITAATIQGRLEIKTLRCISVQPIISKIERSLNCACAAAIECSNFIGCNQNPDFFSFREFSAFSKMSEWYYAEQSNFYVFPFRTTSLSKFCKSFSPPIRLPFAST